MAYLRLSSPSNDNRATETWGQRRYGAMPPRPQRRSGHLLLGLIAMPLGVWGLWLLLGTPVPAPAPAPVARPLVFQVEHPALPDDTAPEWTPGLTIVVNHEPPPSNHPETWGALPTAVAGPVVAAPLADASPVLNDTGCHDAATLAAQMTCIDPTLREADQRMAAAYDAVLAAGVSPADLGRSQARWLTTRDDAARSSPEDLLAAYQLRESQLRNFAVAVERQAGLVGTPAGPS